MNSWYYLIGMLLILFLLFVGIVICIITFITKVVGKKSKKNVIIAFCIHLIFLAVVLLYGASHSTYYKYNDWTILHSNIREIEEKYGEFDLGEIKNGVEGRAAYYIYTDNGPIMPDHLKHYYYMDYDENGIIYHVFDGCQPGG